MAQTACPEPPWEGTKISRGGLQLTASLEERRERSYAGANWHEHNGAEYKCQECSRYRETPRLVTRTYYLPNDDDETYEAHEDCSAERSCPGPPRKADSFMPESDEPPGWRNNDHSADGQDSKRVRPGDEFVREDQSS